MKTKFTHLMAVAFTLLCSMYLQQLKAQSISIITNPTTTGSVSISNDVYANNNPAVYKGKLYFLYTNNNYDTSQLASSAGNAVNIIPNPKGYVCEGLMKVCNDNLYVEYDSLSLTGVPTFMYVMAMYNGTSLTIIHNKTSGGLSSLPISFNNKLYVGTSDGSTYKLAEYNGTTITTYTCPDGGYGGLSLIFNNKLYIYTANGSLAIFNGSSFTLIATPPNISLGNAVDDFSPITYKGKLYISGLSTNSSFYRLFAFDGSTYTEIPGFDSGEYLGNAIVYNENLYFQNENTTTIIGWEQYNGTKTIHVNAPAGFIGIADFTNGDDHGTPLLAAYMPLAFNKKLYVPLVQSPGSLTHYIATYSAGNFDTIVNQPAGASGSPYGGFTAYGSKMYFNSAGVLYSFDGTSFTKIPNAGSFVYQGNNVLLNNKLFFTASYNGITNLAYLDTALIPAPVITTVPKVVTNLCPGTSVTLTSSVADFYLWSNGATTQSITTTKANPYSVTIKTGNNSAISAIKYVTDKICATPANSISTAVNDTSATIRWDKVSCAVDYILQYHAAGKTAFIKITTTGTSYKITGLLPSTTYDWEVSTVCESSPLSQSAFTSLANFTTSAGFAEGISNSSKSSNMSIVPNPAHSSLNVYFISDGANTTLQIMNITGQSIIQKEITSFNGTNNVQFDISKLAQGTYMLLIKTKKGMQVKQFVKE